MCQALSRDWGCSVEQNTQGPSLCGAYSLGEGDDEKMNKQSHVGRGLNQDQWRQIDTQQVSFKTVVKGRPEEVTFEGLPE